MKSTIYLIKIQPKGYSNAIEFSVAKVPTVDDIIKILKSMFSYTKREELKNLCSECITGVKIWGLPKLIDENGVSLQWKTKGESLYSSKGYTLIKPMVCY